MRRVGVIAERLCWWALYGLAAAVAVRYLGRLCWLVLDSWCGPGLGDECGGGPPVLGDLAFLTLLVTAVVFNGLSLVVIPCGVVLVRAVWPTLAPRPER